jgi:putative phage-type endonuclease
MNPISFEQRSPEWLNWRNTGVGASETGSIAAACGVLPLPAAWMDTIQELWEFKVGLRPPRKMHPGMMRGVVYEDEAIDAYHLHTSNSTSPICGEMDNIPYIHASLDGITFDMAVIVETKVPNQDVMDVAESGLVIPYYQPQCAHQCLVAWGHPDQWPVGAEHHFFAYQPETNIGHLVAVKADRYKSMADAMLPAITAFWNNVENRLPPCGDVWLQAAIKYRIAAAAAEQAKALEEAAKETLLNAFPQSAGKTWSGGGVTVTKSSKVGSIQYAQYVKDQNVPETELEKYRGKSSSTVRITVNEKTPMPEVSDAVKIALGEDKSDVIREAWHF